MRRGATGRAGGDRARREARALLRQAGQRLERGDAVQGERLLRSALAADPTFVEPALALSAWLARAGRGDEAVAAADEAVRRGEAIVARLPGKPRWWVDDATRPLLKARVARATRDLEGGQAERAARALEAVLRLAPDDPLGAGSLAAEAWLAAGRPDQALRLYAELDEGPEVCFGRGLALLESGRGEEALLSLWLGMILNPAFAEELLGPEALAGCERKELCADPAQARELAGRTAGLWPEPAREVLAALARDEQLRSDLAEWGRLARQVEAAADQAAEARALAAVEGFLAAERIEARARAAFARLAGGATGEDGRRRLVVLR